MSPREYHAPDLTSTPSSSPRSTSSPSLEMPDPKVMSNSASKNGGAILFFTTFTRVRLPTTLSPALIWAVRRISMRTAKWGEAHNNHCSNTAQHQDGGPHDNPTPATPNVLEA